MSTPISSLRKSKKVPLGTGQRGVPFRSSPYTTDESKLLEEITAGMNSNRRNSQVGALPKLGDPSPRPNNSKQNSASPSDHELMSIMMARLSQLEQKIQLQTREIIDKDKQLRILQEKVSILQKTKTPEAPLYNADLEKKCLSLQQQVYDMETFLADYGMVWVGEKEDPSTSVYVSDTVSEADMGKSTEEEDSVEDGTWNPDVSVVGPEFQPNFDRILECIRDLNVLAGDGVAKVQHTTGGAKLKIPDSVPLALYANGIVMFSGPFRSYDEPSTQDCIRDLQDGYFPSELQYRYPDGVPIQVTDKRHTYFKDVRPSAAFGGSGQILGGDTRPSRLVPSNIQHSSTKNITEETSEIPGPKMSMDQFLKRLPKSVVKAGKIIDIRNSVGDALHGSEGSCSVTVVETTAMEELKARMATEESKRPPSSRDITTLRIKSEDGNQTYILKMKFSETIADLRRYIDQQRPRNSPGYHIMSTFPKQEYTDPSATLLSCGLVPNAALHLKAGAR